MACELDLCFYFTSAGSSGGMGKSGSQGGRGGGIFLLNISNTLDVEGTLSANGDDYGGPYAGGGSGGSILVKTKTFEGSGTLQVCGKKGDLETRAPLRQLLTFLPHVSLSRKIQEYELN